MSSLFQNSALEPVFHRFPTKAGVRTAQKSGLETIKVFECPFGLQKGKNCYAMRPLILFKNEKLAQRGSFRDGYPVDIRKSFARISRAKTSARALETLENKHFGADIHDPKARTSTTLRGCQELRSEKLWAEFLFPIYGILWGYRFCYYGGVGVVEVAFHQGSLKALLSDLKTAHCQHNIRPNGITYRENKFLN